MAGSRGGKKRGGSPKVSATLSKQRFKNTGGLLGAVFRARSGIINDVMMGVGLKEKDYKYEARTARTARTATPVGRTEYGYKDKYGNITNPALSPEAIAARQQARRAPTAAELRAQRKAEELAERKRLGQAARKKFEKEGGEKTAKKKALLLNIT